MGGFKSAPAPVVQMSAPAADVSEAQQRQEARADAQDKKAQQGVQRRRRLQRTGGLRLLFSPVRQEGPGAVGSTTLGTGGGTS